MIRIGSAASLLHAAAQDLHAGKVDAASRLPSIAAQVQDAALRTLLADEAARAAAQAARLTDAGLNPFGPKNLWMAGIPDDAEHDGRSTEPGRLLDIALIGAIRKAKAAEIISSETAFALAGDMEDTALAAAVERNLAEEKASDRALKTLLGELTSSCSCASRNPGR